MTSLNLNFRVSVVLVILLSIAFIFINSGFDLEYIIPRRLIKLSAIIIG
ncbi:iron ABC transporter permease, partial [Vibrio anguillarum]|nr:iron ABC transporter permease [Vibrio anguillarum]